MIADVPEPLGKINRSFLLKNLNTRSARVQILLWSVAQEAYK